MSDSENAYKTAYETGITDPNFQIVHALEFIAVTLGRIDQKLDALTVSVRGGNTTLGKGFDHLIGAVKDAGAKIQTGRP